MRSNNIGHPHLSVSFRVKANCLFTTALAAEQSFPEWEGLAEGRRSAYLSRGVLSGQSFSKCLRLLSNHRGRFHRCKNQEFRQSEVARILDRLQSIVLDVGFLT